MHRNRQARGIRPQTNRTPSPKKPLAISTTAEVLTLPRELADALRRMLTLVEDANYARVVELKPHVVTYNCGECREELVAREGQVSRINHILRYMTDPPTKTIMIPGDQFVDMLKRAYDIEPAAMTVREVYGMASSANLQGLAGALFGWVRHVRPDLESVLAEVENELQEFETIADAPMTLDMVDWSEGPNSEEDEEESDDENDENVR